MAISYITLDRIERIADLVLMPQLYGTHILLQWWK